MTVAQANEQHASAHTDRKVIDNFNKEVYVKSNEFKNQMRAVSFKMGSILPENNSYKALQLRENPSSDSLGLKTRNSNIFKTTNHKTGATLINSQTVSAGNNIAKGNGNFKTVNQQFTHWIQPSAVTK